jgi:RNA polymerase sigma-70 factor, ECF subfamily
MAANTATMEQPRAARVAWSDRAFVERCRRGEIDAFCELAARYQDRLYSFVARSVRDRTDAEDLTQDILVQAFAAIRGFRSEASFKTWLFRIAHNRVVDHSRRSRKRDQFHGPSLDDHTDDESDLAERLGGPREQDPGLGLCREELGEVVRNAVATLSPKLRAVVVLYDFEGCSYEEIAEIVKCPMGTVKSRLFLARNELKRKLASYMGGPWMDEGRGAP